jgi:hypothetical protein
VLWIKRTIGNASDNWREDIYNLTFGNPLILHPTIVNPRTNPIIYNIAVSFTEFKKIYFSLNDNYKKSPLFLNPLITGNRNDRRPLDSAFFRQIPQLDPESVARIKFNDVYRNGPVAINVINNNPELNLRLNFLTFLRLTGTCGAFVTGLKNSRQNTGTSIDLTDYFKSFKRGSAGIRKILMQGNLKLLTLAQQQTIKTFFRLVNFNIDTVPEVRIRSGACLWGDYALHNHFRDFLYKFFNNCLGINTRTSHFVPDRGRGCTFCTLQGVGIAPDESFLHLFYDCDSATRIHSTFKTKFFYNFNLDADSERLLWFGILPETVPNHPFIVLSVLLIQYGIWQAKLKNKIPSYLKIEGDTFFSLATICKLRGKMTQNFNDVFSRSFRDRIQHGGLH